MVIGKAALFCACSLLLCLWVAVCFGVVMTYKTKESKQCNCLLSVEVPSRFELLYTVLQTAT